MTTYRLVIYTPKGTFEPIRGLSLDAELIDMMIFEPHGDTDISKFIGDPNMIMLVEPEPARCKHCDWPIVDWVHTHGSFFCQPKSSFGTTATPKEDL